MSGVVKRALEALLIGAASVAGMLLVDQLRSPYSDVRLKLDELLDRVKGATP
jgi:hypothetical protein